MTLRLALGSLVLLALCGCTTPNPKLDRPARGEISYETFNAADADHSGKLTAMEADTLPFVSRHFGEIDADGDSLLSWNETRNYLVAGPVRPLEELRPRRATDRSGAPP